MAIVAGLEAGLARLGDMVAQGVSAAQAGHISNPAFAVPCPVIVVDQLNPISQNEQQENIRSVTACGQRLRYATTLQLGKVELPLGWAIGRIELNTRISEEDCLHATHTDV